MLSRKKSLYFLSFVLLSVFLAGCSNENNPFEETSPPIQKPALKLRTDSLITFKPAHYFYDTIIGCGYDITEDLFGNNLFKAKVIDFTKYDAFPGENYLRLNAHTTFANLASSHENIPDLIDQIMHTEEMVPNENNKLDELLGKNLPFMKTFKGSYDWGAKTVSYRAKKQTNTRFYLRWTPHQMKEYLTDEFTKDLENLDAIDLVKKYGTHIPLELTTGGVIKVLLGAELGSLNINSYQKEKILDAASFYKSIYFAVPLDYSSEYEKNNDDFNRYAAYEYLKIKSYGGLSGIHVDTAVDQLRILPAEETVWGTDIDNLCTNSCARIQWENSYPLYDFIDNAEKKAQIKASIIQYIADSNY